MQRERATDTALYIPDDIIEAFVEDARRQVADSRPATTVSQPGPPSPAPSRTPARIATVGQARLVLAAASFGFVGWAAIVVLWSWLAIQTGSAVWIGIAVGGGLALVPAAAGVDHLRCQARQARAARRESHAHADAAA